MLLKREDIEREYTKKISEYLGQGYVVNLASMNGTQGEEAKIDLRKGNEVLRIYLDKSALYPTKTEGKEKYLSYVDALSLIIKRYVEDGDFYSDTLWLKDGEEIYRKDYYYVVKNRKKGGEILVDTVDEILRIQDIQYKRRANRRQETVIYFLSDKAKEFARRVIAKRSTYKRISNQDICVHKDFRGDKVHYVVSYKGRTYLAS